MLQRYPQPTRNLTTPLDFDQIQGDLIGVEKNFRCFLFLRFPKQSQAKSWVWLIASDITTAHEVLEFGSPFSTPSMNLALTYSGLVGLRAPKLDEFPDDFKRGMRDPQTALANGDVDLSDPGRWVFPADRGEIHAVLLLAADSRAVIDCEISRQISVFAELGIQLLFKQDAVAARDRWSYEQFNFEHGDCPGDIIIGQPQAGGLTSTGWPSRKGPTAPYRGNLRSPRGPKPAWTRNGSYCVIRRLRTSGEGANAAFPNDRGVVSVSYQSSIHDRFEVLQEEWLKTPARRCAITTGGDYFLVPSIDALAMLGGEQVPRLRVLNYSE